MSTRKFIRHPIGAPLAFTVHAASSQTETLLDVSAGGLCFRSARPVGVGAHMMVEIPVQMPAFRAEACVVWCATAGEAYEIGVRFTDVATSYGLSMVVQVCHIDAYHRNARKSGRDLTRNQAAAEWIRTHAAGFRERYQSVP